MIEFIDWGRIDYAQALDKQTEIFNKKVEMKLKGQKPQNEFIVCQHNNVYTLGLHGKDTNMLVDNEFLKKIDAKLYHINRGGDITYHGPGQITGYPSVDLDNYCMGVRDYINVLEQMVIDVMKDYGIDCQRLDKATGVWLDIKTKPRKICAIGVKISRGITMHGFALNVNTDLKYFDYINPCGFTDKGATSMEKELNHKVDIDQVKRKIYERFCFLMENNKKCNRDE